jgi:hypothetical protein
LKFGLLPHPFRVLRARGRDLAPNGWVGGRFGVGRDLSPGLGFIAGQQLSLRGGGWLAVGARGKENACGGKETERQDG